jgi:glycosyltransferase involved in cell wall biosynthesis
MKVDLHLHSEFSKRPSAWFLKKIDCAECYTEPLNLYGLAKQRGVDWVTITDHNCIDGCREISHLPDTFSGCEVTSYFPEKNCKVHILVYCITEAQFSIIDQCRENIYDLVEYLQAQNIPYVMAHPFYMVNKDFSVELFEKSLLLFKYFEISGNQDSEVNSVLRNIIENLDGSDIEELSQKHGIKPGFEQPWIKRFTGGSDDHSSLSIGATYTEVPGAETVEDFWAGVEQGRAVIHTAQEAGPLSFAHHLYGTAYQFYNSRFGIGKYHEKSVLVRFLDRMLQSGVHKNSRIWNKMIYQWRKRRNRRPRTMAKSSITQILQYEAQKVIENDKALKALLRKGHEVSNQSHQHWFRFVNEISNKMLGHLGDHIIKQVMQGNPFDVFHALGSGGALYTLLAPYFFSFKIYGNCRRFARDAAENFNVKGFAKPAPMSVGHFTDTYHEINGVARMLQEEVYMAKKLGKDLTVITCRTDEVGERNGSEIKYFDPVGVHSLPEYPEVRTAVPPLLKVLQYCYEKDFTHIHSATPGPVGLTGLLVSHILQLPFYTTYHTSMPQYARYLTGDSAIEGLTWRYILWFYEQSDIIFSPSRSTASELVSKGIDSKKIRVIPRGVDTKQFSPDYKKQNSDLPAGLKLLYVGRVSKEKDLPTLVRAYKKVSKWLDGVNLIVVGQGPYLDEMRKKLKGTSTLFMGYLEGERLSEVMAGCDLFVFPSTTDTFGNVVLEAQASGLPVIVSDKGGPCENLIEGRTGIIVSGCDDEALARAIEKLAGDPEKLRQMGEEAYNYAKGRDYNEAFERYWKLYTEASTPAESEDGIEEFISSAGGDFISSGISDVVQQ